MELFDDRQSAFMMPKDISIMLDRAGNIISYRCRNGGFAYSIINELMRIGNIKSFFDFEENENISLLAESGKKLDSNSEKFDFSFGIDNFYTALPIASIRFFKISENQFLGNILLASFLPTTFEKSANVQFHLDNNGKTAGFNQAFFDLFNKGETNPNSLLATPISNYISPTPVELQKQFALKTRRPAQTEWKFLWKKSYINTTLNSGEELDQPEDFRIGEQGISWKATSDCGSFLTLPISVDIEKYDIRINLIIESTTGKYPLVMLGDRGAKGTFRDGLGYLMGIAENSFLIKRQGFTICQTEPIVKNNITSLSIMKIGSTIIFEYDGAERFAHYIFDRIERKETQIILYLRKEYQCILKEIAIYTYPSGITQNRDEEIVVNTTTLPKRFFLLNRIDSYLSAAFSGKITGWRLLDITEMQDKVYRLEASYRKEFAEKEKLKFMLGKLSPHNEELIGSSKKMEQIVEITRRTANTAASVLLLGATGTGKEVIARKIHSLSNFRDGPFVKIDCTSIPNTLMEAELFGYEKGAFTGADRAHEGLFEQANNGTLFIDEIGNIPLHTQAKLLQFLQDLNVKKLGGTTQKKLSLRIITATNANLIEDVKKGNFREDLYYRIAVVIIKMPDLKERLEDLPELCQYFLRTFNKTNSRNIKNISSAAYTRLFAHNWPGNIRELKNIIERAVVFCDQETIEAEHIETGFDIHTQHTPRKEKTAVNMTRDELEQLIIRNKGIISRAASEINVSSRTLYYAFKKMGIIPNKLRLNPISNTKPK